MLGASHHNPRCEREEMKRCDLSQPDRDEEGCRERRLGAERSEELIRSRRLCRLRGACGSREAELEHTVVSRLSPNSLKDRGHSVAPQILKILYISD